MPIHKVDGKYKYGEHGKEYEDKADAERQMRAIKASQAKKQKGKGKK